MRVRGRGRGRGGARARGRKRVRGRERGRVRGRGRTRARDRARDRAMKQTRAEITVIFVTAAKAGWQRREGQHAPRVLSAAGIQLGGRRGAGEWGGGITMPNLRYLADPATLREPTGSDGWARAWVRVHCPGRLFLSAIWWLA